MDDFNLASYLSDSSEEPKPGSEQAEDADEIHVKSSNGTEKAISGEQDDAAVKEDRPSLRLVTTYGGINPTLLCQNNDDDFYEVPIQDVYGKCWPL